MMFVKLNLEEGSTWTGALSLPLHQFLIPPNTL